LDNDRFKLMQFNFLADGLAAGPVGTKELTYSYQGAEFAKFGNEKGWRHGDENYTPFPHTVLDYHNHNCHGNFAVAEHKPEAFTWRTRKLRLLWEVLNEHPCILTAVEVDHYTDFFEPIFEMVGYDGIWVPKIDSPSLGTGHFSDGVLLAWQRDKFSCVHSREGWLKRESLKEVQEQEQDDDTDLSDPDEKLLHVGVCGVVATLKSEHHVDQYLIVVGFHLKSSEGQKNEDRRMAQLAILGAEVDAQLARLRHLNVNAKVSVIFSGDCNSDPVDLPKHGQRADVMRWFAGMDCKVNRAPVRLQSAYTVPDVTDDPNVISKHGGVWKDGELKLASFPATSVKTRKAQGFKPGYKCRMSDFIWFSGGLECEYRLWFPFTVDEDADRSELPDTWREEFEAEETALPGYRYPSDHFAIASVLKFQ